MVRYLNTEAKLEMLKSEFHPYNIIEISSDTVNENPPSGFVNLVLNLDEIQDREWKDFYNHIKDYISYIESDNGERILTFENLLFTNGNDLTDLYQYEYYKGNIYVRMNSYTDKVAMHIVSRSYYTMDKDQVLFFKDDNVVDMNEHFSCSSDYYKRHTDNSINLYYQAINMGNNKKDDRSREFECPNFGLYDKTNPNSLYQKFKGNNWTKENYKTMFGEYVFDISKYTRDMNNLQINSGYRYNNSSPWNAIHYTSVQDDTNLAVEDRCTLLDTNFDNIRAADDYTNVVKQMEYIKSSKSMRWPTTNSIMENKGFKNSHSEDAKIGVLNHKTTKYFNDDLYTEEKKQYIEVDWVDQNTR